MNLDIMSLYDEKSQTAWIRNDTVIFLFSSVFFVYLVLLQEWYPI